MSSEKTEASSAMDDSKAPSKTVVVVGLGIGGAWGAKVLAQKLPAGWSLIAISEQAFAFYPLSAIRASVIPGWENKTMVAVDKLYPLDGAHQILAPYQVTAVRKNAIDVKHLGTGETQTISFSYIIAATGASFAFPCGRPVKAVSRADALVPFRKFQGEVKAAKSIVIVGGGPAGCEFAGEVAEEFPRTSVTLIHSRGQVLTDDYKDGMRKELHKQLVALGVKMVFNTRLDASGLTCGGCPSRSIDLPNGSTIETDFIFLALGSKPNGSLLFELDPSFEGEHGRVKVKKTLQLNGAPDWDHVFAIGDVNDVPEPKLAGLAARQSEVAAKNILSLIAGGKATSVYKSYGNGTRLVTVGQRGGAGSLFGWTIGGWISSLLFSKNLGVNRFWKMYNSNPDELDK